MFKPIDTRQKVIMEVGCCVTGPVHDFSDGIRIGLDPLISNLKSWRDDSVWYIKSVGEYLPLKEECVDIAISWNVLDHCLRPEKVLDEIQRVTKADGTFFILLNTFPLFIPRKLLEVADPTHLYHYSPKGIKCIVSKFFAIVEEKKLKGVAPSGLQSIKEKVGNKMVTRLLLRAVRLMPRASEENGLNK